MQADATAVLVYSWRQLLAIPFLWKVWDEWPLKVNPTINSIPLDEQIKADACSFMFLN